VSLIARSPAERRIFELAEPVAAGLSLRLVRIRMRGGKRPQLQIMVERASGVGTTIDDCTRFSREFGPLLDVTDPIREAYHLEVSTPGIDRPLTRHGDFTRWIGHLVKIELAIPIEGRKRFQGEIMSETEEGAISILLDDETELVCQLEGLQRADLVLTDELIAASQAAGDLPPQPGEAAFGALETQTNSDVELDTNNLTRTGSDQLGEA